MLPLHASDHEYRPGWRIKGRVSGWLRLIFSDQNSRNLFMFLSLNLMMAFVELFYGVLTNSLGLISDSFHMFFDCTALLAGLVATLVSRWRANEHFSYGYVRAEVLAGFINGLLLLFIAFFIFSEAVERLFAPPEVSHDRLFLVSVVGLIVNLIGIFVFHHGGAGHGHSHGGGGHGHSHVQEEPSHGHSHAHKQVSIDQGHGHSHSGHGHSHSHSEHSHDNHVHSHGSGGGCGADGDSHEETKGSQSQILEGVFLHILADTLGSIGVIISSGLIHQFGWMIADPICSLFLSVLISISVIPLMKESASILMQRQPNALDHTLLGCYKRVGQLEGVYSVQEPHFWTLCSDVYIGALKLEVAKDADCKYIQSQTHNIFTAAGVRQLYVQIDLVAA